MAIASGIILDLTVTKLIDNVCSAGDMSDIDREIERFKKMEQAGITDLAIRVFEDPFESLAMIAEHVMPYFARYE